MATSQIHPASLVDPRLHSAALMEILGMKMSPVLIEHVVDVVVGIVDDGLGRSSLSSSSTTQRLIFLTFATRVMSRASAYVHTPTFLVALIYIYRTKPHIVIECDKWANERIFIGALILANKYVNDSPLKNVHWAEITGIFPTRSISLIERELLDVLAFELSISEADFLVHYDSLMALKGTK